MKIRVSTGKHNKVSVVHQVWHLKVDAETEAEAKDLAKLVERYWPLRAEPTKEVK